MYTYFDKDVCVRTYVHIFTCQEMGACVQCVCARCVSMCVVYVQSVISYVQRGVCVCVSVRCNSLNLCMYAYTQNNKPKNVKCT